VENNNQPAPNLTVSAENTAPSTPTITTSPTPPSNTPPSTYIDHDSPSHSSKITLLIGVFVVMIILAGGAYYYLTMMQKPATVSAPAPTPIAEAPKPTQIPVNVLTVESPTDNLVTKTDKVTIKGKAPANATVVAYSESRQTSIVADASGNFETELTLSVGINTITITSFDDKGDEKSVTRTVTYDSQI
jgi:hypothetical protein